MSWSRVSHINCKIDSSKVQRLQSSKMVCFSCYIFHISSWCSWMHRIECSNDFFRQSDGIGRIVSSSDSSKCIVWKGTSQLGIGACTLANKYVHFVYNKLDDTLLLKKNGLKAFSISENILEAGREIVLSTRQSNLLSQTWTLSSETLDDTPLLYYIGNPCTDQFESGFCDVCTGDW